MGKEDSALSKVNVRNRGVSDKTTSANYDSRNVVIEADSI
jgi:hypothetical protein